MAPRDHAINTGATGTGSLSSAGTSGRGQSFSVFVQKAQEAQTAGVWVSTPLNASLQTAAPPGLEPVPRSQEKRLERAQRRRGGRRGEVLESEARAPGRPRAGAGGREPLSRTLWVWGRPLGRVPQAFEGPSRAAGPCGTAPPTCSVGKTPLRRTFPRPPTSCLLRGVQSHFSVLGKC